MQAIYNHKLSQTYHTMIDTKKQEWCSMMEGQGGHLFWRLIINEIRGSAQNIFHPCPYHDLLIDNVTIDDSVAQDSMYTPPGVYRTDIIAWKGDSILEVANITMEKKTSSKESFVQEMLYKKWV
jgi:hypothetical protein